MIQDEHSILIEIEKYLTNGNYKEGLNIIDKYINKSNKQTLFYIELLLRKSKFLLFLSDYTSSLALASKSLILSKAIDDSLLIITSLEIQGEIYVELGQINELFYVLKQIEEQLKVKQEEKKSAVQIQKAEYHKLCGMYQQQISNLQKAIAELQKSLTIFKQLNMQDKIAEVMSRLGYLYSNIGEKENALIIFDSIEIQEKNGNKEALCRSYLLLVVRYLRSGDRKQAFLILEKIFKLLEKSENRYLLGMANNYQGLLYYGKGEFSLALKFLNRSLAFFRKIENKKLIGSLISNIGSIHNLRGELDLSLASFKQSLLIFEELNNQQNIAYHLDKLGSVYARKGELDLALVYYFKSLEKYKELNIEIAKAKILSNVISVSIYDDDLENAQQYLVELKEINNETSNKRIDLWTRISEALVLKSQKNDHDVERAFTILKKIADEDKPKIDIYGEVLLNLCDILLDLLRKKNQEVYLTEIRKYLTQLYEMAKKQDSFWLVAQSNWLLGYLALIELDMVKALSMFTQAQQIAEEKGFKRLAMNISNEFDKMIRKSGDNELKTKQDLSLAERVERSGFENVIKKIKQNIVDEDDFREEKPIMLCIFNSKGRLIYHQTFLQGKIKHNGMIIDEFSSSISNILKDTPKGKKPLQRILYRELLVILKSFDDLSFCYVFDGQSYTALERLEIIITSLQNQSPKLWDKIVLQSKKGKFVDQLTERNLMLFINDLFTTGLLAT